MQQEMNLLDVFVGIWRGIVRLCKWVVNLLIGSIRLTYQRWYIILPLMCCLVVALYWWKRPSNIKYEVEGIVLLNGPTYEHFQQRCNTLVRATGTTPETQIGALIGCPYLKPMHFQKLQSFAVIDARKDGTPDFVDYKYTALTDTSNIRMEDRACIRFTFKTYLDSLKQVEEGLLRYLNSDAMMQQEYQAYMANMERRVRFNHTQMEKLDSLTSVFYFSQPATAQVMSERDRRGNDVVIGNRKMSLFLHDINKHMDRTMRDDIRYERATAPVVLEDHLTATTGLYYHPVVRLIVNCLVGWILAVLLGSCLVCRKEIIAFLRGGK